MLYSQLLDDTIAVSLSRGQGAPKVLYKSALLLEDMQNLFGIMGRKSERR